MRWSSTLAHSCRQRNTITCHQSEHVSVVMNSSDAFGTQRTSPGNRATDGNSGHRGPSLSPVPSQSNVRPSVSSGGNGPSTSIADEETPIVNGKGSLQPGYQSTEGLRHREVSQDNDRRDGQQAPDAGRSPTRPHSTEETRSSWFHRIVENYGTLELENKGSVARDHLALGSHAPPFHR